MRVSVEMHAETHMVTDVECLFLLSDLTKAGHCQQTTVNPPNIEVHVRNSAAKGWTDWHGEVNRNNSATLS
jgi:hypothetical protein